MQLLNLEHAIRSAVNEQRDFDHCAESLGGIISKLDLSLEKRNELLHDLELFFRTYSPGYKKCK